MEGNMNVKLVELWLFFRLENCNALEVSLLRNYLKC